MKMSLLTLVAVLFSGAFAHADLQNNQPDSADVFALCYRAVTGSAAPTAPSPNSRRANSNGRPSVSDRVLGRDSVADQLLDRVTTSPEERAENRRNESARRLRECRELGRSFVVNSNSPGLALQICENSYHGNQANRIACYEYARSQMPQSSGPSVFAGACEGIRGGQLAQCLMTRFQQLNNRIGARSSDNSGSGSGPAAAARGNSNR